MKKTLHLVLTFHWYQQVEDRTKGWIEYRRMDSEKWQNVIWKRRFEYTHIRFQRGMSKRTLTFPIVRIDRGPCHHEGWPDTYFRIHFKEDK